MVTPSQHTLASVKVPNVRVLVQMLQAIKCTGKQYCTVLMGPEGLSVRWEIDSKTLQSSIFLRPQMFSEYQCSGGVRVFGLQFNHLMDTLQVFASSGHELVLKYPNANMQLECQQPNHIMPSCLSALVPLGMRSPPPPQAPHNLLTGVKAPAAFGTIGSLLKETIEDLEWTAIGSNNSTVEVRMQRQPCRLSFTAQAAGSLQIDFPVGDLGGFSCAEAQVCFSYKYKNLRTALSNIPQKDATGVSSKVSIDAQGLMKITHMVNLQHIMDQEGFMGQAAYTESQVDISRTGIVSFMMVAEEEGADGSND
ncbi:MAG: hypothetical protein FRX49_12806 [Trebouxia sp. A1-2]|nr:MAG: hypothetical protein FRX49_12806 [Trebouxia sp. A1-2]